MRRLLVLPLLTILALEQGAAVGQEKRLVDVPEQAGVEVELKRDAVRWLDAVRAGDVKTLVSFALPEARAHVQKELTSEKASLALMLFRGPRALRKYLKGQPERKVVLLRHLDLAEFGSGTTVCYYRPDSVPKVLPGSESELPDFGSPEKVFCNFWVWDQARWYASYSFAEDEDGA